MNLEIVTLSENLQLIENNYPDQEKLAPSGWILNGVTVDSSFTLYLVKETTTIPLALINLQLAEKSNLAKIIQSSLTILNNSLFIQSVWVSPEYKGTNLLPAILYFALRQGRILGRQHIISLVQNPESAIATALRLKPMEKLQTPQLHGLIPVAQTLDYAIYQAYQQCHAEALATVKKYFINEISATVNRWLQDFFQGSWAQAIYQERICKQQYIATLCHWYQFVRQTTQHIARGIVHSVNRELRNHYIYHLKGEINHELLIEHDLKKFDYDLEFLMNFQLPSEATRKFMMVQETAIGFYQNPVLLLACPLAAEGMTAAIKPEFLEALYRCIARWGIANPKGAARFISSHVHTDGGDDGHWNRVLAMSAKFIDNEKILQDYLSVLKIAMDTYLTAHNATIDDYKLWEAPIA